MALYQPTNVIPSSYTKGTVDVNDTMEISWQVNGNSAMTAFQIDFYLNDYASTYVTSTGRQPVDNFYGTDRFGRPQFFTWNSKVSWEDKGFINGNEYKYKITQWYKDKPLVASVTSAQTDLEVGKKYCFHPYITVNNAPQYLGWVIFTPDENNIKFMKKPTLFYYDFTNSKGWFIPRGSSSDSDIYYSIPMIISPTQNNATSFGAVEARTRNENFLMQSSSNIIITRSSPTLQIIQTDSNYQNGRPISSTLSTSINYFKAIYEQEQDVPIRWIRWQVATANNNAVDEILADTGEIYTPTLNYEFNGFLNGQQYAIRALGESESGQVTKLQGADENGWIYFTINIENQGQYGGEFTVECLKKENATLLEWDELVSIDGVITGEAAPHDPNGYTTLLSNSDILWNKVNNDDMVNRFTDPWTSVLKIRLTDGFDQAQQSETMPECRNLLFSPSGDLLIVNEWNTNGYATAYSVNATNLIKISTLQRNGANLTQTYCADFSYDGKYLIVCGKFTGGATLFSVNGTSLTYIIDITKNNASIGNDCLFVKFIPNSYAFILGGINGSEVYNSEYIIDESSTVPKINFIVDLKEANGNKVFNGTAVERASFSPNGTLMILGSDINYVAVFSIQGVNVSWLNNIELNSKNIIDGQAISPNGKMLLLSGRLEIGFSIFSIDGQTITYVKDFRDTDLYTITDIEFSANGNSLILANAIADHFNICSAIGQSIAYRESISTLQSGSGAGIYSVEFSPIDRIVVIGGRFSSGIALYSINSGVQENGILWTIGGNNLELVSANNTLTIEMNNLQIATFSVPNSSVAVSIAITPTTANAFFYSESELLENKSVDITYLQTPISFQLISGGENGLTIENIAVYKGNGEEILPLYTNPNFIPSWWNDSYNLEMSAVFNRNYNAGSGSGFRIYRQEIGKNVLVPIATVPSTTTSVKDYGIVSRKAYKYSLYAFDSNGAFMSAVENEKVVATCFKNYSLLVCDYDETNDEYHVRKQYLFALNLSAGSVGNNNSPTLNANFTRYPTRMPSTQNYASGTLSGLIGAIYTVPALIEQIGNYKYTAKPSTLDYFDNVDLEKELYDLSTAPYQLFLRDMKGRLRMIATNGAISMTTNIKQKQQSISISFPWVEIGDASDVTIIQTPDDYGWNNDNQVLDVQLDVDVATGELSATYPFPYNGTKFYLTGVNKEILTAKTPLGITPAQFEFSETATQPDDGEVTATVKVNSEDK